MPTAALIQPPRSFLAPTQLLANDGATLQKPTDLTPITHFILGTRPSNDTQPYTPTVTRTLFVRDLLHSISQKNWITAFQKVEGIATRADAATLIRYLVTNDIHTTPQAEHLLRRLFSILPYDSMMEHMISEKQFDPVREIGRASSDESLWDLSARPRDVLEKLPHLSTKRAHQLLEWVYKRGRLAELELIFEEEFLVHDTTRFEGTHEEWNALEGRLLEFYQHPQKTTRDEKLLCVSRYIGVPTRHHTTHDAHSNRLSLFARNPHIARSVWRKAQKEPRYLDYLFQIAQLSTFLETEGKTQYRESIPLCTLTELIQTNQGVCETFSFLFSSLAPVIGLEVFTGCYPSHVFIHTAFGDVVIETTADFNLRPAKKYLQKALKDEEFQQPTAAYWLIRWRIINTILMHMIHNKGRWDRRLLMIGQTLFPNDPFFSGSSFQTQLALAHFAHGDKRKARALCKKLGAEIRKDILILILADYQTRGITTQVQVITDFFTFIKKITLPPKLFWIGDDNKK